MTLLSQQEIEARMYHGGIKRAEDMMNRAEEKGAAHRNPYAKRVFDRFVLPLAERIRQDVKDTGTPGRRKAHVTLLAPLDADAVAFLAVRHALNACMDPRKPANERTIASKIGFTINSELVLTQIEQHNPELYHTIANDLHRKMSKDARHRMTVMRLSAQTAGIEWVEWPLGAKEQVGSYLLGCMIEAGMLMMQDHREIRYDKKLPREVMISNEVAEDISKVRGYCAITAPVYGPCVEPPLRWESATGGGFHTRELRRTLPMLVRCHPAARPRVMEQSMPTVLACVNALQETRWAVNTRLQAAVLALAKAGVASEEIVAAEGPPKPPRPDLPPDLKSEDMNEVQLTVFKMWKRETAEWHTQAKLQGSRFGRFYAATRAAAMFEDYPAIHFVYFADSRGRLYPLTYGLNPQGSDLQKALLHFADGKPLDDEEAIRWFHVHGANKFGFDKATLTERFLWAHERRDLILSYAADPVDNRGWLEADCPLQFLAWCFEYKDFIENPDTFVSRLPVAQDGSCNGLQNLSAMLRDEIGGEATNLTPSLEMQDIYRRVAEASIPRLKELELDEKGDEARKVWLNIGVGRGVVKRSVMTTPYGVTKRSATGYVIEDYLKKTPTPFEKSQYFVAAHTLMGAVWPAIGDVVVKGRLCMDWLRSGARKIIQCNPQGTEPLIEWTSPSGFPASQAYYERQQHRITTHLVGPAVIKIAVGSETDFPSVTEHSSGLAPNFVHSMDAAHLHRVVASCKRHCIDSLAMIHDDYGTHAADSAKLARIIREEFVAMYEEHDPVMEMYNKYPVMGEPPAKGDLDIRGVLESEFFFS